MDGLSESLLYAQNLMGGELLLDSEACGLPVSTQIDCLQRELQAHAGQRCEVYEVELEQLLGTQREVAFDAVVAGEPSPFVLVGDRLVCTGSVDIGAVLEAIRRMPDREPA